MSDKTLHTNPDNVLCPLNKGHIKKLAKMNEERGVRCENCGNLKVTIRQFSPDLGELHFCKEGCLIEFQRKNIYRALSAIWIETGKEIQFKKKWRKYPNHYSE